jgi:hypothetical protein
VAALLTIITNLGLRSIPGASSAVLEFDSTAIVSFGEQAGACFGYCGKGRNRRRHYPLVASIAESRAAAHVKYRDAHGIDEKERLAVFADTVARVRKRMPGIALKVGADAGFWSAGTCRWFPEPDIPFGCFIPFQASVKFTPRTATFAPVDTVEKISAESDEDDKNDDEGLEIATVLGPQLSLDARVKVVFIRQRVDDSKKPPAGKKIPQDPDGRYQAVMTSLDWDAADVWRFCNGRGDPKRAIKKGKQARGPGNLVSQNFRPNEVSFLLSILAFNTDILFQQAAEQAAIAEQRPAIRLGLKARQPRLYRRAGRLRGSTTTGCSDFRGAGRWRRYGRSTDRVPCGQNDLREQRAPVRAESVRARCVRTTQTAEKAPTRVSRDSNARARRAAEHPTPRTAGQLPTWGLGLVHVLARAQSGLGSVVIVSRNTPCGLRHRASRPGLPHVI